MDIVWSILRWILGGLFAIGLLISIFVGIREYWNDIKGNVFGHFKDTIFQILQLLFYTATFMLVVIYVLPVLFNLVLLRIFTDIKFYIYFVDAVIKSIIILFGLYLLNDKHKVRSERKMYMELEFEKLCDKKYNLKLNLDTYEELFLESKVHQYRYRNLDYLRYRDISVFVFLFILFNKVLNFVEVDYFPFFDIKYDLDYLLLFIWFLFSFFVSIIGDRRKIRFWFSFFLSIFLTPIIGLIVTLLTKKNINYSIEEYKKDKYNNTF